MKLLTPNEIRQIHEQTTQREINYLESEKQIFVVQKQLHNLKPNTWKLELGLSNLEGDDTECVNLLNDQTREETMLFYLYSETQELLKQDPTFEQELLKKVTNKIQEMVDEAANE